MEHDLASLRKRPATYYKAVSRFLQSRPAASLLLPDAWLWRALKLAGAGDRYWATKRRDVEKLFFDGYLAFCWKA